VGPAPVEVLAAQRSRTLRDDHLARDRPRDRRCHRQERAGAPAMSERDPAEIPPMEIDAERALLGGMILEGAVAVSTVRPLLTTTDFSEQKHRDIYRTLLEMTDARVPIDGITLAAALKSAGIFDSIGGQTTIAYLEDFGAIRSHLTT